MIKTILRGISALTGASLIVAMSYAITMNAHFHLYVLPQMNAEWVAEGGQPVELNVWESLPLPLGIAFLGVGLLVLGIGVRNNEKA